MRRSGWTDHAGESRVHARGGRGGSHARASADDIWTGHFGATRSTATLSARIEVWIFEPERPSGRSHRRAPRSPDRSPWWPDPRYEPVAAWWIRENVPFSLLPFIRFGSVAGVASLVSAASCHRRTGVCRLPGVADAEGHHDLCDALEQRHEPDPEKDQVCPLCQRVESHQHGRAPDPAALDDRRRVDALLAEHP